MDSVDLTVASFEYMVRKTYIQYSRKKIYSQIMCTMCNTSVNAALN